MEPVTDWSVCVRIERDDSRALGSRVRDIWSHPDVREVTHSNLMPVDAEGASMISVRLAAQDATAARVRVQHLLGRARKCAGLPVAESQLLWVAPLAPGEESSHRFRRQAEYLFEAEQYELAVVASQIHVESHIATLLQLFVDRDGSLLGGALAASRVTWTGNQEWQRDLLENLMGRRISKDFPQWKTYRGHLDRRNAIVHRGQAVDAESARESLQVTDALWVWLNEAALEALHRA